MVQEKTKDFNFHRSANGTPTSTFAHPVHPGRGGKNNEKLRLNKTIIFEICVYNSCMVKRDWNWFLFI